MRPLSSLLSQGSNSYICNSCRRALTSTVNTDPTKQHRPRNRYAAYSTASVQSRSRPIDVAIIGSGPAGFYSAYRLLKRLPDARITMFEHLPVPYGLARYGVAPDHPEVKRCTDTLENLARESSGNFHFVGNCPIGDCPEELPLTAVTPYFDALLFAYGASRDKRIGIPGEDLKGVVSARAFVGWYNGLPEYADLDVDLTAGDTAVVIGQGNVALDVTRTLLAPLEELRKSDINEETVEALSRSKVREVKIIGRRGPLQAPYTIKELRELMNLPDVGFASPPEGWEDLLQVPRKKLPRQLKRIAELLEKGSTSPLEHGKKAWQLGFLRSPTLFLSESGEKLQSVGFEKTEYERPLVDLLTGDPQSDLNALRAAKVQPTGQKGLIRTNLAFRSVGYQSEPLAGMEEVGVPFDVAKGIIPNDRWGRVLSPSLGIDGAASALTAGHVPGMYCAGWVKRGPTGVIASTMDDAFLTADVLAGDWEQHALFLGGGGGKTENDSVGRAGYKGVIQEIRRRGIRSVSWSEWEKIDAEERRRGKANGKEREKIRRVPEMLRLLDS
ncbi:NADPH-adrenodoxin reductase [Friedmanniomyces endolithicus]|nr:NADPH-adrenodoxin reductase [Friedmanniomyces endolithicus]KAK0832238.1 NADPH-adrenodoxin reductase [Friedmanniomyces endolithicus]